MVEKYEKFKGELKNIIEESSYFSNIQIQKEKGNDLKSIASLNNVKIIIKDNKVKIVIDASIKKFEINEN